MSYQPTISVPAELNLRGQLILSGFGIGIARFDLSTNVLTPVFIPLENSFVGTAVLSPDQRTYLMIYSPPREPTDPQFGASSLYTLAADGSGEPRHLFSQDDIGTYYFSPWWSPDGRYIYYGRQENPEPGTPSKYALRYFLTRYLLPNGPAEDLVTNALYLRLSADGEKMYYISGDFYSALNDIFIAEPDGSREQSLLPTNEIWIADSLAVSPDRQTIVFSSADRLPNKQKKTLLETLLDINVAQAHSVPSDLFIMTMGEPPRQLTQLADFGFIEDFSPDGQSIAFSCSSGVYIIRPDGTGLTQILSEPVYGSIQWVASPSV